LITILLTTSASQHWAWQISKVLTSNHLVYSVCYTSRYREVELGVQTNPTTNTRHWNFY